MSHLDGSQTGVSYRNNADGQRLRAELDLVRLEMAAHSAPDETDPELPPELEPREGMTQEEVREMLRQRRQWIDEHDQARQAASTTDRTVPSEAELSARIAALQQRAERLASSAGARLLNDALWLEGAFGEQLGRNSSESIRYDYIPRRRCPHPTM